MPCDDETIAIILKSVFENQYDDSEVRIAAFMGIMRCPSYPIVRWIRKSLAEEQVNQG